MESPREQSHHHSTLLIFVILCLLSTSFSAEEEFDYIHGSDRGPDRWGDLREDWAKCKYGTMQSPIPLSRETAIVNRDLGELNSSYKPGDATLKKSGHDVSVEWAGNAGSIKIDGTDYLLQEFHWHHPSEHTVNGERFDMELHMVHTNSGPYTTNKTAVVAVLYRFGSPDPFLLKISEDLVRLNLEGKEERELGSVDPRIVRIDFQNYYRYMGSLTTPPCSEGVIWTVIEKIGYVSVEQVNLLRSSVDEGAKMNARPLQKLNDRDVFFYDSHSGKTAPKE